MHLELYFQSVARCILNKTINEVVITNKGKRNFYVYKQIQSMKERFHEKYRTLLYDESTLDPLDMVIDNMITIKLEEDIDFIRHIISETVRTLEDNGSFEPLSDTVAGFQAEAADEIYLISNYIQSQMDLRQQCEMMKGCAMEGTQRLTNIKDEICDLDSQISETLAENHIKLTLVTKWEANRCEQNDRILQQKEDELVKSICENTVNKEREQIAISEIENFTNLQIQKIEQSTEDWVEKYHVDTTRYDDEIKVTKAKIDQLRMQYEVIQEGYVKRQLELDAYYERQRILNEQRAFEDELCRMAIRVQAWWRGVMVRRQLGPYRPKKKNKKGKSKK